MKSLLSIQIAEKPEEIIFISAYEEWVKKRHPKLISFSLDNFSEESMITYAKELIAKSDCILILIESQSSRSSLNKLLKLFNSLGGERFSKGRVVLIGEHSLIEKMTRVLAEKTIYQPSDKELMRIAAELFS